MKKLKKLTFYQLKSQRKYTLKKLKKAEQRQNQLTKELGDIDIAIRIKTQEWRDGRSRR